MYKNFQKTLTCREKKREKQVGRYQDGSSRNYRSRTWGTALAVLLNNNGHDVTIWSAFDTEIQEMSRTRRHKNLPEVVLPDQIQMTADLRTAMAEKDMLIMAVPSVYVAVRRRR